MKTITQYREDIAALMKTVNDIEEKCIAENRGPTEEELDFQNEAMNEIDRLRGVVATMERKEALSADLKMPERALTLPGKKIDVERKQDNFRTFGEQLVAVYNAEIHGTRDPRLYNAASGLNEAVTSDGGYLVQTDFTNELLQEVFETGLLAPKCRRINISGNANGITINGVDETSRASTRYGGIVGYWKGEADEKTKSKPKFREIELKLKKLTGLCYATDELLADATALESFIRQAFVGEFGFLLDDAIINGTGANQPLGIMNSGCLVSVSAETGQPAATIQTENIVNMYSRRLGDTSNYAWYYNRNIEPQLFTMSLAVGTGGSAVYMPPGGLSGQPYGTLMGLPAIAIEQCATLGTTGDIILANFKDGYILAEKGGIQADMSIHVRFIQDESVFRFVMRVDGQPHRASALTPYKGGASSSQSHFIVLETRS
jgi:HK97 family phage major capsid protein